VNMTVSLKDALDDARYVDARERGGITEIWVWHGGHTVNFYREALDPEPRGTLHPSTCISVGDFETGETTLEDVREGIESHYQTAQQEA